MPSETQHQRVISTNDSCSSYGGQKEYDRLSCALSSSRAAPTCSSMRRCMCFVCTASPRRNSDLSFALARTERGEYSSLPLAVANPRSNQYLLVKGRKGQPTLISTSSGSIAFCQNIATPSTIAPTLDSSMIWGHETVSVFLRLCVVDDARRAHSRSAFALFAPRADRA
ncbi:uncharacterized protein L969DRAFT_50724 [Mixia osmundae IAM 14324]|uniref:Uncharacterized protein n=1 Tax=Mixia osmundae (strain CBS 9802 / IAM 14324 / JCM 22182 / KY 12970) TaxID=764103 RepID=G7DZ92_MIXOS|nr:uncharacterized protein L969DRAFT_50724 [Mixia osmundae IAM 14324]KEI38304.1 hypothetical protein L969DRAFT_50724 [Mixia osmundae IAM 14324]GAA95902.1 hypothetical protein E5Q_02560 [Mixia osmundae IAM 14324]